MKTYKTVKRKIEDTVRCDMCDYLCTIDQFGSEYATLEATWGYGSKKDGKKYDIQLCELCFDKIIQYIKKHRKEYLSAFSYPINTDPLDGEGYNIV